MIDDPFANHMFSCTGKVALVTGGNSGIGLGFAKGIARMGGDVAIWSNNPDGDTAAREQLQAAGAGRVLCATVDVRDEGSVIRGFDHLLEALGRIDCVFANAGVPPNARSFLELESQDWFELLAVNLHGAFYTIRHAARRMVQRAEAGEPGGSLVFCGSLSMFQGFPGTANYAAAKAGMGALMRTLAVELGPHGIRANTVAPGYITTGIAAGADRDKVAQMEGGFAARTPLRRVGKPDDLAGIAAYLCSDASGFHTGDTLVIDGGTLTLPAQAV